MGPSKVRLPCSLPYRSFGAELLSGYVKSRAESVSHALCLLAMSLGLLPSTIGLDCTEERPNVRRGSADGWHCTVDGCSVAASAAWFADTLGSYARTISRKSRIPPGGEHFLNDLNDHRS